MAKSWRKFKYRYIDTITSVYEKPRTTSVKWWYRLKFFFIKPISEIDKHRYSWSKTPSGAYPYDWVEDYYLMDTEVYSDLDNGLKYVLHQGKKLYFKRDFSIKQVRWCYRALLIEQDPRSAHRYVSDYKQLNGKTLLDIGAAEGIFSLEAIDELSWLYLFECEEAWIEALEATFAPWSTKTTIVPKYVDSISGENSICLDDYLKNIEHSNVFIKMDIEGYESAALGGAKRLLQSKDIMGVIAIYHKDEDEKDFSELFTSLGFNIEIPQGYLCIKNIFRHAILKFWK